MRDDNSSGSTIAVASLNLNKKLGRAETAERVAGWLDRWRPDVFVVQEPRLDRVNVQPLPGWILLGGNASVSAWVRENVCGRQELVTDVCRRVWVRGPGIYNVYLDVYSAGNRARQLGEIEQAALGDGCQVRLVVGDFNIGPRLQDGLWNAHPSKFNSRTDRGALETLCASLHLVDLGAEYADEQWTHVKMRSDGVVQFRCDLALLTGTVANRARLEYDHTVREQPGGFTDHSALMVTIDTVSG